MAIHAVITGDIVNSTGLVPSVEKKLINNIKKLFDGYIFEFYRGDSFQVFINNPAEALVKSLLCRTAAVSLNDADENMATDIRLSIGVGNVRLPVRVLATAKGEAFILSGRAFDNINKTGARLAISSANPLANVGLAVISDYINSIFGTMTGKQAAVIFELMKGKTQQQVAAKFKKSKSTINQHVSSAQWPEIENLILQYEKIIKHLI
jgi:hypothetical protein